MNDEAIFTTLLAAALQVKQNAYAPYSHFHVGAALRSSGGKIFTGCNVENASFGLTICAERSAIVKMISEGETMIEHLLVIGDTERFLPPCGACRQVMAEFAAPDAIVWLCAQNGAAEKTTMKQLLPYIFFLNGAKPVS